MENLHFQKFLYQMSSNILTFKCHEFYSMIRVTSEQCMIFIDICLLNSESPCTNQRRLVLRISALRKRFMYCFFSWTTVTNVWMSWWNWLTAPTAKVWLISSHAQTTVWMSSETVSDIIQTSIPCGTLILVSTNYRYFSCENITRVR